MRAMSSVQLSGEDIDREQLARVCLGAQAREQVADDGGFVARADEDGIMIARRGGRERGAGGACSHSTAGIYRNW